MKGGVYFDPEATLVGEHFAIVNAPRGKRQRFPEQVVELMPDEASARATASAAPGRHAACVAGPARSSEGLRMYYLVRWLDDPTAP